MSIRISSISKEYVKVPVRANSVGEDQNPTQFAVSMAFMEDGSEPELSDWVTSDWETWPDNFYMARCLVGPGSNIELTNGKYDIWVRIVTPQEDVKRYIDDRLVVT